MSLLCFSPSICYETIGQDAMILAFIMLNSNHCPLTLIKWLFSFSSLSAILIVSLAYRGYWYFSQQSLFQLEFHPGQHFPWCILYIRWQYTALTYSFSNFEQVDHYMSSSNFCFLKWIQISQDADKLVWYSHLYEFSTACYDTHSERLYHSLWSKSINFSGIPLNSLKYSGISMIQQMLAIWSLIPLSFLNPYCTSGSSRLMYCSIFSGRQVTVACWMDKEGKW